MNETVSELYCYLWELWRLDEVMKN